MGQETLPHNTVTAKIKTKNLQKEKKHCSKRYQQIDLKIDGLDRYKLPARDGLGYQNT